MKFAGHETFHLRDGWLRKGLSICDVPGEEGLLSPEAADILGVGSNMIKSIRHWLSATMLTNGILEAESGKVTERSELAKVIQEFDPYFQSEATWWALHVNLVNNSNFAFAWNWFFNDFKANRFEKAYCVESLKRSLEYNPSFRCPAQKTLEKDVSVILASYAQTIPRLDLTPEDTKDCPFLRLGLLTFSRESGFYIPQFGMKSIPSTMLGYSVMASGAKDSSEDDKDYVSLSIGDAVSRRSGPGRALLMRPEELYDYALKAEQELGEEWIRVRGMAGNRMVEIKNAPKEEWLKLSLSNEQSKLKSWRQKLDKKLQKVG
ncbi:MAG: DUF4007 family protein [Roseibacillus sp.]